LNITSGGESIYGDDVELQCMVSGIPLPSIAWERDGVQLSGGSRITISHTPINSSAVSSLLRIASIDTSDDGSYTCRASNRVGGANASIALHVLGEKMRAKIFSVYSITKYIIVTAMGVGLSQIVCVKRSI